MSPLTRKNVPTVPLDRTVRLWLHQQGLLRPRGTVSLTRKRLSEHLERVGGLQMDPINAVDRAHYLTLWSRFGAYDRSTVDRWIYRDRIAVEYWVHEASLMPMSHLPLGRRRMADFPPKSWRGRAWWSVYQTSPASKRRVLKRLTEEGPLESSDFELRPTEVDGGRAGGSMPLTKEDGRSLRLLWHGGRVAVHARRHARCVYDLAERVYPDTKPVSRTDYEDSWVTRGLLGNGIASEKHLMNYITAPDLSAVERKSVIGRALRRGDIAEVKIEGVKGSFYVLPELLEALAKLPEPVGTNLICPFDSLLWQRRRAEELFDYHYRIEIYTPPARRQFGYYVLPIMHDGRLVGRLDPKMHRDQAALEIKSIHLEPWFKRTGAFKRGLGASINDLAEFLGADAVRLPRGWTGLVRS